LSCELWVIWGFPSRLDYGPGTFRGRTLLCLLECGFGYRLGTG